MLFNLTDLDVLCVVNLSFPNNSDFLFMQLILKFFMLCRQTELTFSSVSIKLQLVRSNSRRFMPSQADEEAHQLSYLQKHLANILSLLAEPVEGEGEESLVCTVIAYFI